MPTADDEAKALTAPAGPLRRTWEKIATVLALIGLIDLTGQLIKWAGLIHWVAEKYAAVKAWLFSWLPLHIPPEWHDPIVLFLIFFSLTNIAVYRKIQVSFLYYCCVVFIYNLSLLFLWPLKFLNSWANGKFDDLIDNPPFAGEMEIRIDENEVFSPGVTIVMLLPFFAIFVIMLLIVIFDPDPCASSPDPLICHANIVLLQHEDIEPMTPSALLHILGWMLILSSISVMIRAAAIGILVAWRWLLTTAAIFGALVAINYAYIQWLEPLAEHH
jgi:hypothetical protein